MRTVMSPVTWLWAMIPLICGCSWRPLMKVRSMRSPSRHLCFFAASSVTRTWPGLTSSLPASTSRS